MLKFQKVLLAGALAFTGIVGTSIIDTPKVEAASASVTAQQTTSRLVDGAGNPSSKINGAGQYGRITLQCGTIYPGWQKLVLKKVKGGWFDEEIATLELSGADHANDLHRVSNNVWLEKGELYYIEVIGLYNATGSLSNYNY
ncbi:MULTISPECIES: hypothetical protein [Bacillus]|uniref:hypothetical protein n=1 Tax=Bacillus TaxID=1386 RepID=UPI000BF41545|nr:hypothetical protein [Bacillus cereus]MDA2644787.1 hypothetical protein [Bacillus cereus]PFA38296.1 hypothetical protein CN381_29265 [Bacillus cereus]WCT66972.1 hypothetical protein PRK74_26750 [Bacillus cereus]HDR4457156.1 hypothetical protein [Bacillus cereus]HDR8029143.1 hypothetical protein [Bacillus cereus]